MEIITMLRRTSKKKKKKKRQDNLPGTASDQASGQTAMMVQDYTDLSNYI